jgi:hypothetical protein
LTYSGVNLPLTLLNELEPDQLKTVMSLTLPPDAATA